MTRSSFQHEVCAESRLASGLLGGVLLLCLVLGLSGCASLADRSGAESGLVDDMVASLTAAADQADALCGPGSAEAAAARAAVTDVQSHLVSFQDARMTVNNLRSQRIDRSTRIDELQRQIGPWEDEARRCEAEAVRNAGGGFDDGALREGTPGDTVSWCDRFISGTTTNLSDGGPLHSSITGASGATPAERTEADRLMAELISDKAVAEQAKRDVVAAMVPGDNTHNDAVRRAYAAGEAAANRSHAALLRLKVLNAQIELRALLDERRRIDADLVTRQQEYRDARADLDAAIQTAETAAAAAEARANGCAGDRGLPAPTWPRTPGWNSTFWDISS